MRLLRQIADACALGDEALAVKLLVQPGHDAQQGGLAGAVDAEHADLGVGVKGKMHIIEHFLAAGPGLGQTLHMVDKLTRHRIGPAKGELVGAVFKAFAGAVGSCFVALCAERGAGKGPRRFFQAASVSPKNKSPVCRLQRARIVRGRCF